MAQDGAIRSVKAQQVAAAPAPVPAAEGDGPIAAVRAALRQIDADSAAPADMDTT